MKNETWVLATLPEGRTIVENRWIFSIKQGHKDVPTRYKARLVAKGYTQEYGVDYEETFAPVVKYSTIRTMLGLVAVHDLEILQLDVKTAFLYGELSEEIYMSQPEGFIMPGHEDKVCRLKKCIYGLKQAPRVWNAKFNQFILDFDFVRSLADPCICYRRRGEEEMTMMTIFVDDGLICCNEKKTMQVIIEHIKKHFEIRTMVADRFLGLEISRNRSKKELYVTQPRFIENLLKKFRMQNCSPKSIPADPHTRLTKEMSSKSEQESMDMKKIQYKKAVGSLLDLTTTTRPDIAYAVGQVSQFSENPGNGHWNGVKRILAYLAGTSHFGIRYRKEHSQHLLGFSDADFGGDMEKRRSTTGYVFLHCAGPIIWSSRKQTCTALSTTEAEFIAGCESSKEAIWIARLLKEIAKEDPIPVQLFCDNQSAIRLVKNPEFHQRTKHIDIKYHFIRDQQANGIIDATYVNTTNQLADIFTKPLEMSRFESLLIKIGIVDLGASQFEGRC